jgi:hypothetical protein
MNLQAEDDYELQVEQLFVGHESQVFEIDRSNSSTTIEGISRGYDMILRKDLRHQTTNSSLISSDRTYPPPKPVISGLARTYPT